MVMLRSHKVRSSGLKFLSKEIPKIKTNEQEDEEEEEEEEEENYDDDNRHSDEEEKEPNGRVACRMFELFLMAAVPRIHWSALY